MVVCIEVNNNLKLNPLCHRSSKSETEILGKKNLWNQIGQVFFTGYHLLDLSLNQQHLHIFSYDTDSQGLCNTRRYSRSSVTQRRGTIKSEIAQARKQRRWETTQKSLPVLSLFTMAGTEKSSAFIQVSSLSPPNNLTHLKVSLKSKWGQECDGACALSLSLRGGV